jgi:hypothetical protein
MRPTGVAGWLQSGVGWVLARPWLSSGWQSPYSSAGSPGAVCGHGGGSRHHAAGARLVHIAPPPQVEAAGAAALWANLAGILTPSWRRRLLYGSPHVVLQYLWRGRRLLISLWVPGTVPPGAVEAAVSGGWPGAVATTDLHPQDPIPGDAAAVTGGQLLPVASEWLPLRTDHDTDPLRALVAAAAQLRGDEHACVQILARPATPRRASRARRAAARVRAGRTGAPGVNPAVPLAAALEMLLPGHGTTNRRAVEPAVRRDPGVERDVRAIVEKTSQQLWETGVRYAVAKNGSGGDPQGRVRGVADAIAASFAVYAGRNQLGRRVRMPHAAWVLSARRLGTGFLTCTAELAAMAGLPRDLAVPGLDGAHAKAMPVPVAVPSGGAGHQGARRC